MKVYLVFEQYYSHNSRESGTLLCGVYVSEERAINARNHLIVEDINAHIAMGYPAEQDFDINDNPRVIRYGDNGEVTESIYTIGEFEVQ